jgi:LuxR family quorum-sensing system transcriptional regulator SinR
MGQLFFETMQDLQRAGDIEQSFAIADKAIRSLGPQIGMYGVWDAVTNSVTEGDALINTYSDEWNAHYLEHFIGDDPVLLHAAGFPLPFVWDEAPISTPRQQAFMDTAAEAEGLKFGIAAQLPAGRGKLGAIALHCAHDFDARHVMAEAYAIAMSLHSSVQFIQAQEEANRFNLTLRHIEILKWQSAGKTYWEIGQILGVSENMIRKQTQECYRRLGVHNATQAISLALRWRLIG